MLFISLIRSFDELIISIHHVAFATADNICLMFLSVVVIHSVSKKMSHCCPHTGQTDLTPIRMRDIFIYLIKLV